VGMLCFRQSFKQSFQQAGWYGVKTAIETAIGESWRQQGSRGVDMVWSRGIETEWSRDVEMVGSRGIETEWSRAVASRRASRRSGVETEWCGVETASFRQSFRQAVEMGVLSAV